MLPPFTIRSDGLQHHLTQAIVVLLITRRYQSTGAVPAPRVFRRHRHNILLPICLRYVSVAPGFELYHCMSLTTFELLMPAE